RTLGSFPREWNDIHVATPDPEPDDLARAIFRAQGKPMTNLGRLQRTWECPQCRRYRRIALAVSVAAGCALVLRWLGCQTLCSSTASANATGNGSWTCCANTRLTLGFRYASRVSMRKWPACPATTRR